MIIKKYKCDKCSKEFDSKLNNAILESIRYANIVYDLCDECFEMVRITITGKTYADTYLSEKKNNKISQRLV